MNPVDLAIQDIGLTEYPPGTNKVKFNTWYYGREVSGANLAWCMAAVQYWYNAAGWTIPYKTAYCPALYSWARARGYVTTKPVRGDIVLYDWNGDGTFDHTGIVESWDGLNVTAIEGNTSSGNYGDQSNGGGVYRRTRSSRATAMVFIHIFDFSKEDEEDMDISKLTDTEIRALWERIQQVAGKQPVTDPKMAEELEKAKSMKITDGTNPMRPATRLEVALMAKRAAEKK